MTLLKRYAIALDHFDTDAVVTRYHQRQQQQKQSSLYESATEVEVGGVTSQNTDYSQARYEQGEGEGQDET